MVVSGFGLSAFFFSTFAHTLFPGDTGSLLLVLALGSSLPMLLGFFIVRPIPPASPNDLYESIPAAESRLSIAEQWDTFSPVEGTAEQEAIAHVRESSRVRSESRTRRTQSLAREDIPFLLTDGVNTYRGRSRNAARLSLDIPDRPIHNSQGRERERSVSMHRDFIDATSVVPEVEVVDIHGMSLFGTSDFWILFSTLSLRTFYMFTPRGDADNRGTVAGTGLMCGSDHTGNFMFTYEICQTSIMWDLSSKPFSLPEIQDGTSAMALRDRLHKCRLLALQTRQAGS